MFDAVYESTTSFNVGGDRRSVFKPNVRIMCYHTSTGYIQTTCVSAAYDSGTLLTTVTIIGGTLQSSLFRVAPAGTYYDSETDEGNVCEHPHISRASGGAIPAATISPAQTTTLKTIPIPTTGQNGRILIVAPTVANGYQIAQLLGTEDQVDIVVADGQVQWSLPQDIATNSEPEFAGLTLSELTGVLVGGGTSQLSAIAATGSLTVIRRNADNSVWECALVNVADLGDALITSVAANEFLKRNAANTKWINAALILSMITDWPSGVSTAEVEYLDGVTSAIQSQIDAKEAANSLKLKQSIATLTDAADITPDFSASNNFTATIAGNRTIKNGTGPTVGQRGMIYIVQGTGGNHTLTWESYYKFPGGAPTLSTAEGAVDAIEYDVRTATNIVCRFFGNIG